MSLTPEWYKRIVAWKKEVERNFFKPLFEIPLEGFFTFDHLTLDEAKKQSFVATPVGTQWGKKWEYGWFRGNVTLPAEAQGQRVVIDLGVSPGNESESLVFVNGKMAGSKNWAHPVLTLTRSANADEKFEIYVETYAWHGGTPCSTGPVTSGREWYPEPSPAQKIIDPTKIGIWDDEAFGLYYDVETLFNLREQLDDDNLRRTKIDAGLRDFSLIADFEISPEKMAESFSLARKRLKPLLDCINGPTAPQFFTFGHAHLDVCWLWPLDETKRKIARTMSTQLALAKEYPEYRYLQSQAQLHQIIKDHYPELFKDLKKAVKNGSVIAEGGMWVEADTNITSGESLIRQFIHGKRFFKEEYGVDNKVLWLPDVFGYCGALPQIMAGCKIPYFSTCKLFWTYNGAVKFPHNAFWWEGIDGTRTLSFLYTDYNSHTAPSDVLQRWKERPDKESLETFMMPFGHGDGGGGPTRGHLEYLRREKDLEGLPRCSMSGPVEFFEDLQHRGVPDRHYVGELYFQAHRGTYTSQAKIKRGNRKSELGLREAEAWTCAAAMLTQKNVPYAEFDRLWKMTLLNQFHDILPGSSITRVCEEAQKLHTEVILTAASIAKDAAMALTKPEKDSVVAFNSLSWERTGLVELPKEFVGAIENNGSSLAVQIIEGKPHALATLPSCGWASFKESPAKKTSGSNIFAKTDSIENEYLRLELNDLGEITGIFDKEAKREISAGSCNSFKMYQDIPAHYDAWDLDSIYKEKPVALNEKAQISVIADGPLVAIVRIKRVINESSYTQDIIMCSNSRRVDFKTTVDWKETHKLLKVAFPVAIHANEAVHEIQFGHIKRPNNYSNLFDTYRFEVSNHKWTLLAEENRGFAVLNDCKYGVNVLGNSINLTLLKSATAPDPVADKGMQEFTYSIYPYNSSFADSGVVRAAYELNCPIFALSGRMVEKDYSMMSVSADNIIIETIKPAEKDPQDMVIRVYESKRMATRCDLKINLPFSKAVQSNMLEEEEQLLAVKNGTIALEFRPFEIKTIKIFR